MQLAPSLLDSQIHLMPEFRRVDPAPAGKGQSILGRSTKEIEAVEAAFCTRHLVRASKGQTIRPLAVKAFPIAHTLNYPVQPSTVFHFPLLGPQVLVPGFTALHQALEGTRLRARTNLEATSRQPPYAALIRALIESEQIAAARTLLAAALAEEPSNRQLLTISKVLAPPTVMRSSEKDVDRSREYLWLKTHAAQYRDQWVAVDGETLVASANSLKELLSKLETLRLSHRPLVHHIE